MALAANALTVVATLESELSISAGSATALLERIINTVSDAVEGFCDRKLYREVIAEERVAGYGTQRLLVSRRPLVSIEEISIEGVVVDEDDYRIDDAEAGTIFRRLGWSWTASLQSGGAEPGPIAGTEEKAFLVSYTAGYVLPSAASGRNLPYDLEQAAIIAAVAHYRGRGKYARIVEESATGAMRPWYDYLLPPNARALLQRYKRVA